LQFAGRFKLKGNNNPDNSEALSKITLPLNSFFRGSRFGKSFVGDLTDLVRQAPDTGRGIDLAVVSHDRLRKQPPRASALHVAPELAIEIMSPSHTWKDAMEKIEPPPAPGRR
jgi:hypothetical protein